MGGLLLSDYTIRLTAASHDPATRCGQGSVLIHQGPQSVRSLGRRASGCRGADAQAIQDKVPRSEQGANGWSARQDSNLIKEDATPEVVKLAAKKAATLFESELKRSMTARRDAR